MDKENKSGGRLRISDDVITEIVTTSTLDTQGVAEVANNFADEFFEKISRKHIMNTGVEIKNDEDDMDITVNVTIKENSRIKDVAKEIQRNVKTNVENMTGLKVGSVCVNVTGIM
ncbi:MAG: Asp23/Gls24 family envelope stress response protein [Firmicutes bacterium]|nr:Asp23/Gls24 family envelope stress response protein [Bacillota bacterium]